MKQIYNFEQHHPPVLNENMIRAEMERRKLHWQTALLVLAGILLQVVVALFGYSAMDWYPWISSVCFGYIIISTTGCGIVAVIYSRKGGIAL
ncbi:MAG: hypothetical protein IKM59_05805 [Oscillospiraceae bacterium]|nr:hypothetical protein [Oscillospiraceae bacterium]